MKKLTVKDFITYNNPCFSCGKKITFKVGFYNTDEMGPVHSSFLRPVVMANYTEIDLKITYIDAVKLYIFHKDNKILSNNQSGLTKYLNEHKLFLSSTCTCHTEMESETLDFHLVTEHQRVAAVNIKYERLMVNDGDNVYQFNSSFLDKKSTLIVYKREEQTGHTLGAPAPTVIEMPLIPKYKFKNKDHFLEKMKTYILFS